jgi:tetratricopeptide (TPR) repeat protein
LELDPSLAEAHNSLGGIREFYDWDWPAAEKEYRRAIELNPNFAAGHCLDLSVARRYREAVEKCQQALEIDPHYVHAHGNLVGIYTSMGMYDRAVEEYERTASLAGESPAQVAELKKAFHQGGAKGFLRMMVSKKANEGADAIEVASLYSLLGETDQAFAWLGKAYQRRSPFMEFLKEDPDFDHLRSDPRFSELVRRAGLED